MILSMFETQVNFLNIVSSCENMESGRYVFVSIYIILMGYHMDVRHSSVGHSQ